MPTPNNQKGLNKPKTWRLYHVRAAVKTRILGDALSFRGRHRQRYHAPLAHGAGANGAVAPLHSGAEQFVLGVQRTPLCAQREARNARRLELVCLLILQILFFEVSHGLWSKPLTVLTDHWLMALVNGA